MISKNMKKIVHFPPLVITVILWLAILLLDLTNLENSLMFYPFAFLSSPSLYLHQKLAPVLNLYIYPYDFYFQALLQIVVFTPFYYLSKRSKVGAVVLYSGISVVTFLFAWGWI